MVFFPIPRSSAVDCGEKSPRKRFTNWAQEFRTEVNTKACSDADFHVLASCFAWSVNALE